MRLNRVAILIPLVAVLLPGCSPLRNDDVQREIASMEQVSLAQIDVIDVAVGDGWSDGAEAKVRYRICRDSRRSPCVEKQVDASFALSDSGHWEMIYPRK